MHPIAKAIFPGSRSLARGSWLAVQFVNIVIIRIKSEKI